MTPAPQQRTETPAQDHHEHAKTKIEKQITPWHHDRSVINFSVAGAPSALISAAGAAAAQPGGARC